jgi:hypothetical protein
MLRVPQVGRFGLTHFAGPVLLTWRPFPLIYPTQRRLSAHWSGTDEAPGLCNFSSCVWSFKRAMRTTSVAKETGKTWTQRNNSHRLSGRPNHPHTTQSCHGHQKAVLSRRTRLGRLLAGSASAEALLITFKRSSDDMGDRTVVPRMSWYVANLDLLSQYPCKLCRWHDQP